MGVGAPDIASGISSRRLIPPEAWGELDYARCAAHHSAAEHGATATPPAGILDLPQAGSRPWPWCGTPSTRTQRHAGRGHDWEEDPRESERPQEWDEHALDMYAADI
jgi:hypothetical protein